MGSELKLDFFCVCRVCVCVCVCVLCFENLPPSSGDAVPNGVSGFWGWGQFGVWGFGLK